MSTSKRRTSRRPTKCNNVVSKAQHESLIKSKLFASVRRGNLLQIKDISTHESVLIHSVRDRKQCTLLHEAAYWDRMKIAKWLIINAGVPVDVRNNIGDTPLHFAVRSGHETFVRWLVDKMDANIYSENNFGETAFQAAAKTQNHTICEFMVNRRAKANVARTEEEEKKRKKRMK